MEMSIIHNRLGQSLPLLQLTLDVLLRGNEKSCAIFRVVRVFHVFVLNYQIFSVEHRANTIC